MDIRFIFGKQISIIGSTMGSHQDFHYVDKSIWLAWAEGCLKRKEAHVTLTSQRRRHRLPARQHQR